MEELKLLAIAKESGLPLLEVEKAFAGEPITQETAEKLKAVLEKQGFSGKTYEKIPKD